MNTMRRRIRGAHLVPDFVALKSGASEIYDDFGCAGSANMVRDIKSILSAYPLAWVKHLQSLDQLFCSGLNYLFYLSGVMPIRNPLNLMFNVLKALNI